MMRIENEFVKKLDAFFDRTINSQIETIREGHLKQFWDEWKPTVIQVFNKADKWDDFLDLIEDAVDETSSRKEPT